MSAEQCADLSTFRDFTSKLSLSLSHVVRVRTSRCFDAAVTVSVTSRSKRRARQTRRASALGWENNIPRILINARQALLTNGTLVSATRYKRQQTGQS